MMPHAKFNRPEQEQSFHQHGAHKVPVAVLYCCVVRNAREIPARITDGASFVGLLYWECK